MPRLLHRVDPSAQPDINRFVLEHGRMPFLSDPIPPWHYRGWLLFQVQLADAHPNAPGRWHHYMRMLEAGRLLDEPIPQLQFTAVPDPSAMKILNRCVELLAYRNSFWEAFEDFVQWLAWGLSVSKERPELEEATSEALYRTFNFEHLLLHPHDYLGQMLCDRRGKGWNPHAYYPTPHPLCECMMQMVLPNAGKSQEDSRLQLICEPAAGTGRMLLHASNYSYRLHGMDIDPLVVTICLINGAIYVPWLSFPLPRTIVERCAGPTPGDTGRDNASSEAA